MTCRRAVSEAQCGISRLQFFANQYRKNGYRTDGHNNGKSPRKEVEANYVFIFGQVSRRAPAVRCGERSATSVYRYLRVPPRAARPLSLHSYVQYAAFVTYIGRRRCSEFRSAQLERAVLLTRPLEHGKAIVLTHPQPPSQPLAGKPAAHTRCVHFSATARLL